jgi:hypothetical protein
MWAGGVGATAAGAGAGIFDGVTPARVPGPGPVAVADVAVEDPDEHPASTDTTADASTTRVMIVRPAVPRVKVLVPMAADSRCSSRVNPK